MTAESQQKLFELRYRTGLCRYCGGKREDPGRVGCWKCVAVMKAGAKRRHAQGRTKAQRFRLQGKCRCGEVLAKDWTICGRQRLMCPKCVKRLKVQRVAWNQVGKG